MPSGSRSRSGYPIVLVHGGFMGAWCWDQVSERLARAGMRVFTPTLAGLGERAHLLGTDITLSTHIDEVTDLILREDLTDIVLCGHSYAGMVITGVAGRVPDRITTLVYLDAILPQPGRALWDYLPETAKSAFDAATRGYGIMPARAGLGMVNARDAHRVNRLATPHPRATLLEPLPAPQFSDTNVRKIYVFATGYASPMLQKCADAVDGEAGWERFDLQFGHNLMIDAPKEVATILLDATMSPPMS